MTFVVIAHYRALPGAEDQVAGSLGRMTAPSRAEPGNLAYNVCRSPADATVFAIYEEYVDEAAFIAHTSSDHFARWLRAEVLPRLQERHRHDLVPLARDEPAGEVPAKGAAPIGR
ncbi:putative quinol monooxygenase [Parafrankia discariae]|uniref:putative quinol monooxygenase n=1 Tax=Parafrankia discariae TaxID=365528 RepID=UPI0003A4F5C2|nr:antibiotic biosynthesis monooxygenase family protein [Parafrankia discariae]